MKREFRETALGKGLELDLMLELKKESSGDIDPIGLAMISRIVDTLGREIYGQDIPANPTLEGRGLGYLGLVKLGMERVRAAKNQMEYGLLSAESPSESVH